MLTVSVASTRCPPPRLAAAAGQQAAQITRRQAPQLRVAPRHSRPTWGTSDGRRTTCRRGLLASSNSQADGDGLADPTAEQQQSQQQQEQQQADPPPAAAPRRAAAPPPSRASLIFTILVVTVTAVANRVLYKVRKCLPGDLCLCPLAKTNAAMAAAPVDYWDPPLLLQMSLVPLGNYVFFLAQLQTFGYLLVYFTVLALRYRRVLCFSVAAGPQPLSPLPPWQRQLTTGAIPRCLPPCRSGQVSKAMLAFPMRAPGMFLAIGLVEALSSLLGFLGAANLPGTETRGSFAASLLDMGSSAAAWGSATALQVQRCRLGIRLKCAVPRVPPGAPQAWCCRCWPRPSCCGRSCWRSRC